MSHDVFISYSSKDKATADAACAALESRGVRCWIAPRDVLPGRNWGEAIIDAISQAKVMMLVYSAHANASTQVQREVERAASKDVVIVPFRVENAPLGKAMEYFLSSPHWLDAFPPPADQYFGRLVETVQRLLPPNAGSGAAPTTRSAPASAASTTAAERPHRRVAPRIVLALVAILCAATLATFWWRSHPKSHGGNANVAATATQPATTGPTLTLADIIPLKAQADVAYERAQKFDRANGMGKKIDETEPTRRTAQAYLDAKDYAGAKLWYEKLLAQLKEVALDEADRAEANRLIAQAMSAADAAKAAGADPSADSWTDATAGLANARELMEAGDFYKARVRAWAAGERYGEIQEGLKFKQSKVYVNSLGMKFVRIEPGEFMMGTPPTEEGRDEDETLHKVKLTKPFLMGVREVTRGQFAAFVMDSGYLTDGERLGGLYVYEGRDVKLGSAKSWRDPGFPQGDDHPVVGVSWNDAVAFAQWLSKKEGKHYRLPTEAEWEYACRAGSQAAYPWGDEPGAGQGWCNAADLTGKEKFGWNGTGMFNWADGFGYTAPVGQFRPNALGLYDIIGNAWEWCADWYDAYPAGEAVNPTGPANPPSPTRAFRIRRGGSWGDVPPSCRSGNREGTAPDHRFDSTGFRLCLNRSA